MPFDYPPPPGMFPAQPPDTNKSYRVNPAWMEWAASVQNLPPQDRTPPPPQHLIDPEGPPLNAAPPHIQQEHGPQPDDTVVDEQATAELRLEVQIQDLQAQLDALRARHAASGKAAAARSKGVRLK